MAVKNDAASSRMLAGGVAAARHLPSPQAPPRCPRVRAIQPTGSKGTTGSIWRYPFAISKVVHQTHFCESLNQPPPHKGNRELSVFRIQTNKGEKRAKGGAEVGHKKP